MAYHAPGSAANAPAPVGAGTVTRMTLDEFGALKIRAAEERRCAAPPSWTLPPLQAISEDLASMGLVRQYDHAPLLSFLNASDSFLNTSDSRVCRGPLISFSSAG
jgi:hypothetical protein